MTRKTRKYEPSWVKLKKNAEVSKFNTTNQEGKIMLQITTSTNPKVITAHANTAIDILLTRIFHFDWLGHILAVVITVLLTQPDNPKY